MDKKEFHRFRWAHANANSFLYGMVIIVALVAGLARSFLGFESNFLSKETLYILIVIGIFFLSIPYFGYKLARYIVGSWYLAEFGASYKDYRANERLVKREKKQSKEI